MHSIFFLRVDPMVMFELYSHVRGTRKAITKRHVELLPVADVISTEVRVGYKFPRSSKDAGKRRRTLTDSGIDRLPVPT